MLSVELYDHIKDIYNLDFISRQQQRLLIICPGPDIADALRENIKIDGSFDVITISKFINDEFKRAFVGNEIHNKASMLLLLGTVFKKIFSNIGHETFLSAFDSFTELRAFTTDLNLVSEVLEDYPKVISQAIAIFWEYVEQAEVIDEHKSYFLLSEAYRSIEHPIHPEETNITISNNIVFWGFKHLSAGQVDLLNAMSIRHDVYVPFAQSVYNRSNSFDWIRWLAPTLPIAEVKRSSNCQVVRFSKNRMAEALASSDNRADDVFLMTSSPDYNQVVEIPYDNILFKTKANIFDSKLNIAKELLQDFFTEERSKEDIIRWLDCEIQNEVTREDFRQIKLYLLIKEVVDEYCELSEVNDSLSMDDFRLIIHVCFLRLPRVYSMPSNEKTDGVWVRGIEALEAASESKMSFLCASSEYSSLAGQENRYSEKMMEFLKEVGPVRRADFILQIVQQQIIEVLSQKNSILFLEQGLEEHDLAWNRILESFQEVKGISASCYKRSKSTNNFFEIKQKSAPFPLSATKLQSYMDCPRQYYYKYVERIESRLCLSKTLQPFELGEIEHEIIEKYFCSHDRFDDEGFSLYVEKRLLDYIKSNNKILQEISWDACVTEVTNYCRNGLSLLFLLKNLVPQAKFQFETSLVGKNITGRIDCLVSVDGKVGIVDFKRSNSSVPSLKEITSFKKIQLSFYGNYVGKEIAFAGFLNLSDPEESTFIYFDDAFAELTERVFSSAKKVEQEFIDEYRTFEKELVDRLCGDESFEAAPAKNEICNFCQIKNICSKGGGHHETA